MHCVLAESEQSPSPYGQVTDISDLSRQPLREQGVLKPAPRSIKCRCGTMPVRVECDLAR
jgi:hypothetical protein